MEIESIEQPRQRGASQQLLPVARGAKGPGELKNTRRDDGARGGMEEAAKQACARIPHQTEKTRQSNGVKGSVL